jgi:type IV secretory pathway TrbD component
MCSIVGLRPAGWLAKYFTVFLYTYALFLDVLLSSSVPKIGRLHVFAREVLKPSCF